VSVEQVRFMFIILAMVYFGLAEAGGIRNWGLHFVQYLPTWVGVVLALVAVFVIVFYPMKTNKGDKDGKL